MITLRPYSKNLSKDWDLIVAQADNGYFMFSRNYMDYHAERFTDASYFIYDGEKIIGVFPANREGGNWYSHQRLTFGGILLDPKYNRFKYYCEIYPLLFEKLKQLGIVQAVIKLIPHIYHQNPCEAEFYILNQHGIQQNYVELATTLDLARVIKASKGKLYSQKQAIKNKITIVESGDYEVFWQILNQNLSDKYDVKAVHSLAEIILLHSRFPKNIRLFLAVHPEAGICGGTVFYQSETVIHVQYIAANSLGQEIGALALLFLTLIEDYRAQGFRYFDFGISTNQQGSVLNQTLVDFKEGFSGRSVIYHTIEIGL